MSAPTNISRELDDGAKRDRPKVVFGLGFAQRVGVNRFSVDQFRVVAKRRCGEVEDGLMPDAGFASVPRGCLDVVCFIDLRVWLPGADLAISRAPFGAPVR